MRDLLLEGTSLQQQVSLLPQTVVRHGDLCRLKFLLRLAQALEAPVANTDSIFLSVKWAVWGSNEMRCLGACG